MKIILVIYILTGSAWRWNVQSYEIQPVGVFDSHEECEQIAEQRFKSAHRYNCLTEENYKMTVALNQKETTNDK